MRFARSAGYRCVTVRSLLESLEDRRHLSTTLKVPGTANPWLLTGVTMPNPGTQPPVYKLATGTGRVLTFPTVTGTITNGTASNGADGRAEKGTVTGVGGLSGFKTDLGFFGLVGVFTTEAKPTANPPATLDATNTRSNSSFSPKLNQVFFIGDGKTGTGSGTLQTFKVPDGATKLYLGFPDSDQFNGPPAQYLDNGGSLNVTIAVPAVTNTASIAGNVFNDADSDGVKDTSETGISGVVIYNDANNNGVKDTAEASVTTDASGNYKISGLAPATYKIRQILPAGYKQTLPTNGYGIQVVLANGQAATGRHFGDAPIVVDNTASLSGTVFNDADADGAFDTGELGLGLWQVYLDANNNGTLDTGEKAATTDVNGAWAFTGLASATYVVRVVQVASTATTTASFLSITLTTGQAATGNLFGETRIA